MIPSCTILCRKFVIYRRDVRRLPTRGVTIEANQDPKLVKSFERFRLEKSSIRGTAI